MRPKSARPGHGVEAQFADVDALITAAEAEAARAPQEETTVGALTEQERQEAEAALDLVIRPTSTSRSCEPARRVSRHVT
ncbi:hypothetical protein ACE1OC_13185 [Streptomyces sp. DSM 116496]|uniref:hypothetical protein n=1 Tax=Streptomyces stoeckheimensis TaxID=3344656 RepID=UPI0038B242C4